jgi:hypothetical protein
MRCAILKMMKLVHQTVSEKKIGSVYVFHVECHQGRAKVGNVSKSRLQNVIFNAKLIRGAQRDHMAPLAVPDEARIDGWLINGLPRNMNQSLKKGGAFSLTGKPLSIVAALDFVLTSSF